jgi:hypothetical protein
VAIMGFVGRGLGVDYNFFLVVVKESFRDEVCCRGFRWGLGIRFFICRILSVSGKVWDFVFLMK